MSNPGPNVVQSVENLGGGSPYTLGNSPASLVGAYGATPIPQPASTGNVHTVAAGATTGVFTNTTFDGSLGMTAYTVGDLVAALKTLGFLAL